MTLKKRNIVLWAVMLLPYLCLLPAIFWYVNTLNSIENSSFIIINKSDFTLAKYNFKGELLQKSKIALGRNPGNKSELGDLKTPEGVFRIGGFEDASKWTHDFPGDSLGEIKGAYGPYFIRLQVPGQKGIGIHGTHDINSIGTRASEGCIRMLNQDVAMLIKNLKNTSIVVIVPGIEDLKADWLKEANVAPLNNTDKKRKSGEKTANRISSAAK